MISENNTTGMSSGSIRLLIMIGSFVDSMVGREEPISGKTVSESA